MHVLKSAIPVLLCLSVVCAAPSYAKTHKKVAAKHPAAASTSQKANGKKSAAHSKSRRHRTASAATGDDKPVTKAGSRSRSARGRSKGKAVARRSMQQAPSPDRYREIQQALADKGYFKGSVDGTWGADSVSSLKRFQKDQNLTDTGKLDSLSLIALGLGPKRNLSARSTTESRPKDDNRRPEGSERP